MTRLIELARQRGIDELVGGVLPENTMMLQLCREFGFTIAIDPNDRQLLRVGKLLQRRLKPHRESPNSSRPLNSSGAASVLFTVIYRS
jgi:hypothetical protein